LVCGWRDDRDLQPDLDAPWETAAAAVGDGAGGRAGKSSGRSRRQGRPEQGRGAAGSWRKPEAWSLVDGNIVADPAAEIVARLSAVPRAGFALLAVSVMPGPQLTQAVAVCTRVRAALPHVPIVWGGYFPTQHADTVLRAPHVDFVIRSQGEQALLQLVDVLRSGGLLNSVGGLSWKGSPGAGGPGRPGGSGRASSCSAKALKADTTHAAETRRALDAPDILHRCAEQRITTRFGIIVKDEHVHVVAAREALHKPK
jgi:hypothetical protein